MSNRSLSDSTRLIKLGMGVIQNMKKAIALASVLTLSAGMLAACGSDNNNENASPASSAPASSAASESQAASEAASPAAELTGKLVILTHRTDLVDDGTMDKYAEAFKAKYAPNAELEF